MKRILIIALIVVLIGVCLVLGINGYVCLTAAPYLDSDAMPEADCILVLGCGVRPDGQPSLMLRDRLDKGLALYEAGAAPKLLLSGDHGRAEYDEVNGMKNYVMAKDIPSEDVFLDHAGFSTYESAYRARDIFQAKTVVIVSQRYHLYRAVYIARSLGLDAWGVSAEDISYFGQLGREAREVLARSKDLFYCLVQPEPTYLGEAIPISGDGNLTNG